MNMSNIFQTLLKNNVKNRTENLQKNCRRIIKVEQVQLQMAQDEGIKKN